MATAAKLAITLQACERTTPPTPELSVAEELALLSGEEIFAASQETSRAYNGQVLAKAIVIVQIRIHCPSLPDLARRMRVPKSNLYRRSQGLPLSDAMFHRAIRDLAVLLEEEGVSRFERAR